MRLGNWTRNKLYVIAATQRLFCQNFPHLSAAGIADKSHGIEIFVRGPRQDEERRFHLEHGVKDDLRDGRRGAHAAVAAGAAGQTPLFRADLVPAVGEELFRIVGHHRLFP